MLRVYLLALLTLPDLQHAEAVRSISFTLIPFTLLLLLLLLLIHCCLLLLLNNVYLIYGADAPGGISLPPGDLRSN